MTAAPRFACWSFGTVLALALAALPAGAAEVRHDSVAFVYPQLSLRVFEKSLTGAGGPSRVLGYEYKNGPNCVVCDGMVLGTEDPALDLTPQIAVNPVTTATWIVWAKEDIREGDFDIHVSTFSVTSWTGGLPLSRNSTQDSNPRIAIGPDGNVHVVWESDGEIEYRTLSREGNVLWAQNISRDLATTANSSPVLSVDSAGRAWVAYIGNDGSGPRVFLAGQGLEIPPGGVNTAISPLRVTALAPLGERALGDTQVGDVRLDLIGGAPLATWLITEATGRTTLEFRFRVPDGGVSDVGQIVLTPEITMDRAREAAREFVHGLYDSESFRAPIGGPIRVLDPERHTGRTESAGADMVPGP